MRKLLLLPVLTLLIGCQTQTPTTPLDPDRILHMAGEEAGMITAARERLTRQLNIANRETLSGRPGNALITLGLARQTLEKADKKDLSDQERLAGWISLCELARNAEDKVFAGSALDQAMAALDKVTPDPARCEYVPGIEREVRALRGDAAAATLLRTAAVWAMDLQPQPFRRSAYLVFTEELFRCNDYEGGRGVLRRDEDAAWRSDALTALADRARWETRNFASKSDSGLVVSLLETPAPKRDLAADMAGPATSPSVTNRHFGKSLDFKSNYYRP